MIFSNSDRLKNSLEQLAKYGANDDEGITRVAFTDTYKAGRDYVKQLMIDAGLEVVIDPIGNLIGTLKGNGRKSGKIITGSHIDTVRRGGMFDGTLGVLGGVEAALCIRENNIVLDKDLVVVAFIDEEVSAIGSRAYTGIDLPKAFLTRLEDNHLGLEEFESSRVNCTKDDMFIELHIEQGRVLEEHNIQIGEVVSILSSVNYEGKVTGRADHAGATPMDIRVDAFMRLAEYALRFRELVKKEEGSVGTIGKVELVPGQRNVIPGSANFVMEMRTPDEEAIIRVEEALSKEFPDVELDRTAFYSAAKMDKRIVETINAVSDELNLTHEPIHSGAGHDSQSFEKVMPTGMIFVPSVDGISHNPKEFSKWEDCANGVSVLANVLIRLSKL